MSDVNFKKLNELEVIEEAGKNTYAVVEENGVPKRIPGKKIGGGLPSGGAPYQQLVTDGEGVARWEDRTHYSGTPIKTTIIPETTATGQDMGGVYVLGGLGGINPDLNGTYTVVLDGKEYESEFNEIDEGVYYLGNPELLGIPITGGTEPFAVLYESDVRAITIVVSDANEHTYSITCTTVQIHPMHKKYLPMEDIIAELKRQIVPVKRVEIYQKDTTIYVEESYDELLEATRKGILLGYSSGRMYIASQSYAHNSFEINFFRFAHEQNLYSYNTVLAVITMDSSGNMTERAYKLEANI